MLTRRNGRKPDDFSGIGLSDVRLLTIDLLISFASPSLDLSATCLFGEAHIMLINGYGHTDKAILENF